ncbi:hypothetical protein [Ferruginibacter sp. SUN106]|uniref:hypothetical protein n=1 Tax=Ferruginibacter sp. SUN106 TaxID=2978348 RepID=UPI003D36C3F7
MENKEDDLTPDITTAGKPHRFYPGSTARKILVLFGGIMVLAIFFVLPANRSWLKEKIFGYWNDYRVQHKQLSLEKRKAERFTTMYTYSKEIAGLFEQKGNSQTVLVLIPTEGYFKKYGITYPVPEPVTFYYFTNLKTVWARDTTAIKANWVVSVQHNKFSIDSITSVQQLKDSISAFQKF